jgi:hypothetical protein
MHVLRAIWQVWKRVGRFVGDVIARILLTVFYFTIFVPFGMGVSLLSDPLQTECRDRSSLWLDRSTTDLTLDHARRQF